MFTAASSRIDEIYEDCPVVHLSESPEDLRHFLRVLLPKSQRTFVGDGSQTTVSFEQIFAVVRLSHKYQVDDVLHQAMAHLKKYYTTRPDLWEGVPPFTPTHGIGAVNLAVLIETPAILPRALLDCASLGSSVLDGWTKQDGSVENLSADHLRLVLDARDRLIIESFYGLKKVFGDSPSIYCGNWQVCRNSMCDLLLDGMDGDYPCFGPATTFESWDYLFASDIDHSLCSACMKSLSRNQENVLGDLWRRLPTFFHLNIAGWPEDF